ncbi:MAG: hypothetical protein HY831_00340 [Candidatus Aenigmarchaeota archaeon]|nr:hypothetical protein [Candidatus Aenigmarchaeota archaeon]
MVTQEELQEKLRGLSELQIPFDTTGLSENEIQVLDILKNATSQVDELFLEQMYSRNLELRDRLSGSTDPLDAMKLRLLRAHGGPWDSYDHNKPFIENVQRPIGCEYYPRNKEQ